MSPITESDAAQVGVAAFGGLPSPLLHLWKRLHISWNMPWDSSFGMQNVRMKAGPAIQKREHENRMRNYGWPAALPLLVPRIENIVGAHPILMRAIALCVTKGRDFVL